MPDAIDRLRDALWNKGPNPQHHAFIEHLHRKEWPTLWKAIDEVIAQDAIKKVSNPQPPGS